MITKHCSNVVSYIFSGCVAVQYSFYYIVSKEFLIKTVPTTSHPLRQDNLVSDKPRGYEVEITVPVSDVEKLWDEIKDKITEKQIAQPLVLKRWGKWDFRVIDPFGFYIRFTELVDWGQE